MVHAMTNVYMKHIYNILYRIYNLSVYIKTFDLRWPLKVK